ncbi:putative transcriptional regulator, AraC family [Cupriavidus taiwanensis]|uniref:AraC family transcriptional regulator n=1 Tax=Cupriavidus taiwanensis TaxID=164546 RepID=UPI000E179D5D|nr:AraC family transcriptional regulator [Cupriavidus taiwanensis]SPA16025.1 putative transcriptional regulator, AraC family [Cupriavidus taiwanensis]
MAAAGHILTRAASLTDYEPVARAVGLDPFRMLRLAKIPAKALDDPNLMISADSVGWLLEESARRSGEEAFGLLLSEKRSLANLGVLALVLREEPTLRAAMLASARYLRLHNDGVQLRLEDAGNLALLLVDFRRPGVWRQAVEQSAGIALRAFKALTQNTFRPVSISFTHEAPSSLDVHRRVLGTNIEFSKECNAIVCRGRELDKPIPAAAPELSRELKRLLDVQLASLEDDPNQQAREVIKMLLPTGLCSVERISQHLGINRRTLNRHLARSGESVTTIIHAVRLELAEEYLANSRRKLYEVAELLGFSTAGDFSRWFRRGFGKTPSDWVADHRQRIAAPAPRLDRG